MDNLPQQFLDYVEHHRLFKRQESILVAISGGVDSVVLGYLLHKLEFKIGLAHVNYQLRGQQSDKDEEFVQGLASQWGVACYTKHFDTSAYAHDQGISIQMAARDLRYQWFKELLNAQGYHKLATAHHLNDVLETMLLNLVRGTGLKGLQGITPQRDHIVRPLLFATKEQILDYAQEEGLQWQEDQSNQEDYYQRNLIRNKVVPILKEINPQVEFAAAHTAEITGLAGQVFQDYLVELRKNLVSQDRDNILLDIQKLKKHPLPLWFELLQPYGFNFSQVKSMAQSTVGSLFYSKDYQLNVDRQYLIISPLEASVPEEFDITDDNPQSFKQNQKTWKLCKAKASGYQIQKDPQVGAWDFDKVRFPLKVRSWKQGDWFHPLGMDHKKKLSDFLVDQKIPMNYKRQLQVVTSGDEIIWLIGHRIDDRYKITDQTKTVLEIRTIED